MFARRKKSPFKGPMLNPAFFATSTTATAFGSPAIVNSRARDGSDGHLNLGLKGFMNGHKRQNSGKRKSQIIEEEEEDEFGSGRNRLAEDDEQEEEIEEVDAFAAVQLGRGERVQSITILNDSADEDDATVKGSPREKKKKNSL